MRITLFISLRLINNVTSVYCLVLSWALIVAYPQVLEAAKRLHLKEHAIFDGSGNVFKLAAPVECKGIVGSDDRWLLSLSRSLCDVFLYLVLFLVLTLFSIICAAKWWTLQLLQALIWTSKFEIIEAKCCIKDLSTWFMHFEV